MPIPLAVIVRSFAFAPPLPV
jgi:hypothetical protein